MRILGNETFGRATVGPKKTTTITTTTTATTRILEEETFEKSTADPTKQ